MPFQRADALNLKDFSPSFRLGFGTFNYPSSALLSVDITPVHTIFMFHDIF